MWEQLRDPWTLGFGYAVPEFVDSEGLRYLRLYDVDERLTGHPGHKFGYQPAVGHSVIAGASKPTRIRFLGSQGGNDRVVVHQIERMRHQAANSVKARAM